jgi:DNA polymerase (family X)
MSTNIVLDIAGLYSTIQDEKIYLHNFESQTGIIVRPLFTMVSNKEIRRLLGLYSELLQLHEQNEKLAGYLSGAGYYTRRISNELMKLDKKEISTLFRPPVTKILLELKDTGTIAALDELIQLTPAGLFEMMRIKGLGGKKLSIIWHKAKIDTIEGLLKACQKNKLSAIPGFGVKTQKNITRSIESYLSHKDHFRYGSIAEIADRLVENLMRLGKTKLVSLCGEIRRKSTTLARIEIISAKKFTAAVLKKFMVVRSSDKSEMSGITFDEVPVTLYFSTATKFYEDLFTRTGNEQHVVKVLAKVKKATGFNSEEIIYKKAALPFVIPEMREDNAEWNFKGKPEDLITLEDIKGVVHNHTTWSDGVDSLEDFVQACVDMGFEYTVISDHSKNAHYAGGLKEEKLLRQLKVIDALNKKVAPFRIFKSIECDIRVSGDLDYEPSILKKLDLVIVSIHQFLKMDEEKATRRLIKAIEHPYTTIIGHMTGRMLLIRPGYPINFKKVIDACAANKVNIEINSNPYRLDMDWSHIPYALKKGVMISVNPDAHSIKEIDNIRWGIAAARKGGLTKPMTWNAMGKEEIDKWLREKRGKEKRKIKN